MECGEAKGCERARECSGSGLASGAEKTQRLGGKGGEGARRRVRGRPWRRGGHGARSPACSAPRWPTDTPWPTARAT
eukprot:2683044-Rhodomonas_salina.1